jgi:hypothetical protein
MGSAGKHADASAPVRPRALLVFTCGTVGRGTGGAVPTCSNSPHRVTQTTVTATHYVSVACGIWEWHASVLPCEASSPTGLKRSVEVLLVSLRASKVGACRQVLAGLSVALAALKEHRLDGFRVNLRALRRDRAFCAFLVASVGSFAALYSADYIRLSRQRRKDKALRLSLEVLYPGLFSLNTPAIRPHPLRACAASVAGGCPCHCSQKEEERKGPCAFIL